MLAGVALHRAHFRHQVVAHVDRDDPVAFATSAGGTTQPWRMLASEGAMFEELRVIEIGLVKHQPSQDDAPPDDRSGRRCRLGQKVITACGRSSRIAATSRSMIRLGSAW